MKKLVFMFVAVAAISFASCGNKAQQAPVDTDSIAEVVDSTIERNERPLDVSPAASSFLPFSRNSIIKSASSHY